jgi:hypothetical protein
VGLQPCDRLFGHARQGLAVEMVTREHGHAAAGIGADGDVPLAAGSAHRGIEDRTRAGFAAARLHNRAIWLLTPRLTSGANSRTESAFRARPTATHGHGA